MKFIALVSGGKDSCFNIQHCLRAGHELVAMANLHPRQGRPDEIDSWMFQTVGYKAVEYIAECSGVPLYRAEISEDEEAVVHELSHLFDRIKQDLDYQAVSVGAIASTYQQTRVDAACSLSNLRSLAYLWQRDQSELLREIVASGLDARIIKVAGMGLDQTHLGKSLGDIESDLLSKHQSFGLHPCGEGGEYETLVLDAPFFKSKRLSIVPNSEKVVQHSSDDVYYLELQVSVEPKPVASVDAGLFIPPLIDPAFSNLLSKSQTVSLPDRSSERVRKSENSPAILGFSARGSFDAAFAELERYFQRSTGGFVDNVFHVLVVLKDMGRFAEMNKAYMGLFGKSDSKLGHNQIDPSRAAIQADIAWDVEVTVFRSAKKDPSGKGIHVQGLSYWAPASIGPYPQCRLEYGISYVAGQIGLIPASLELAFEHETQALLALQNAERILNVVHEFRENWTPRLGIAYITSESVRNLVLAIWQRLFNIPLITILVEALPRGALIEWSIQACDTRYFKWFLPDEDAEELLYSSNPEVLYANEDGYMHRSGFQLLEVSLKAPSNNTKIEISVAAAPPRSAATHWIPATAVYYGSERANSVYINFN